MQKPGLLPFAVLSQTTDHSGVLQTVAQAIDTLPERRQQANVAAATGILAGLILDKPMIRRLLRREIMRESVIYQEMREEAREEAWEEVWEEAWEEAQKDEARSLVLRLLKRKLGTLDEIEARINTLTLNQLEDLGEALLDFSTLANLSEWLEQLPK